jgi:hypothetical protein
MTTDEYIGESSKAMATLQKYAIDKGTYYLRVSADASRVYSLNMAQTAWKLQAGKKKSRRKLPKQKQRSETLSLACVRLFLRY